MNNGYRTKILVADDDRITLTLIQKILEPEGYVVIKSSDGFRAWEVLNDNPDISLVITDLMMPDMDGPALIRSIRRSDEFKQLPILMISGVKKEKELGDIDLENIENSEFLSKPLEPITIKQKIRALISRT